MAGIGFELKKLFNRKGVIARIKAYSYAGAITAGPMLLGFAYLLSINYVAKWTGIPKGERDLLTSMITYSLLASMIISSFFSMVLTRYVADMLYEDRKKEVLPSLEGVLGILLPLGGGLWFIFLCFSGVGFTDRVLLFCLFTELLGCWTAMNYLSAIKDYRGIMKAYLIAALISVVMAVIGSLIFGGSVELMLLCVVIGYGIMFAYDMGLLYRYFPNSDKGHFNFLPWFDEYNDLTIIGVCTNIGLLGHLVIAWFGPVGVHMEGAFYGAPQHDIPALFAFISVLVTTINFVVSVEVNFYPKYRRYYDLFNQGGSIVELKQAESEMLTVLENELIFTAKRQLYFTAILLSVGLAVLGSLPLGFDAYMDGYFRVLCVGYGAYAVGNVLMLILMYFTDYKDAKYASIIFAVSVVAGSVISLSFKAKYYGFAFAIGSIIYFVFCAFRLKRFTKRLPYHILSSQPIYTVKKVGMGSKLLQRINDKGTK